MLREMPGRRTVLLLRIRQDKGKLLLLLLLFHRRLPSPLSPLQLAPGTRRRHGDVIPLL